MWPGSVLSAAADLKANMTGLSFALSWCCFKSYVALFKCQKLSLTERCFGSY